ncbi:MAG: hypothetical protein WBB28_01645 [Crinalium sp.]
MDDRYGLGANFSFNIDPNAPGAIKSLRGQLQQILKTVQDLSTETAKSSGSFNTTLNAMASTAKRDTSETASQFSNVSKAVKNTEQSLVPLRKEFRALRAESRNTKFGEIGDKKQFANATADVKQYISELRRLERQVVGNSAAEREFAATLKAQKSIARERLEVASQQRKAATASSRLSAAQLVQGAGRGVLNALEKPMANAVELQQSLGGVQKLANDISDKGMVRIKDATLELSSAMGVADTTVSALFEDLASSAKSFADKDIATRKAEVEQILKNKSALDISAESASSLNTTLGSIYKESLPKYSGGIVELNSRTASAINDVADKLEDVRISASDVIPVMNVVLNTIGDKSNFPVSDIVAYSAAISALGTIEPEAAGSFFNRFSSDLSKDIAGFAKVLDKSVEEMTTEVNTSKLDVVMDVVKKYKALQGDEIKQGSFLQGLGIKSVQDQKLIQGLANNISVVSKARQVASAGFQGVSVDEKGVATLEKELSVQREFGRTYQTAAFQSNRFRQSTRALMDTITLAIQEALTPVMQVASDIIGAIIKATQASPALTKALSVTIYLVAGLAVAVGATSAAFFAFAQAEATASAASTLMMRSLIPLTGFYETTLKAFINTPVTLAGLNELFIKITGEAGSLFATLISGMESVAIASYSMLTSPMGLAILSVSGLYLVIQSAVPQLNLLGIALSTLLAPLGFLAGLIKGVFGGFADGIASVFKSPIVQSMISPFKLMTQAITQAMESFALFSSKGEALGRVFGRLLSSPIVLAANTVLKIWDFTIKGIAALLSPLVSFAEIIGYGLVGALAEHSPGTTWQIADCWEWTADFIAEKIASLPPIAQGVGLLMVEYLANGLIAVIELGSVLHKQWEKAANSFQSIISTTRTGVQSTGAWTNAFNAISRAVRFVADSFDGLRSDVQFQVIILRLSSWFVITNAIEKVSFRVGRAWANALLLINKAMDSTVIAFGWFLLDIEIGFNILKFAAKVLEYALFDLFDFLKRQGTGIWTNAFGIMGDSIRTIGSLFNNLFSTIGAGFSRLVSSARDTGWNLVGALAEHSPGTTSIIRDCWAWTVSFIGNKLYDLVDSATAVGGQLINKLVPDDIVEKIKSIASRIKAEFDLIGAAFFANGAGLFELGTKIPQILKGAEELPVNQFPTPPANTVLTDNTSALRYSSIKRPRPQYGPFFSEKSSEKSSEKGKIDLSNGFDVGKNAGKLAREKILNAFDNIDTPKSDPFAVSQNGVTPQLEARYELLRQVVDLAKQAPKLLMFVSSQILGVFGDLKENLNMFGFILLTLSSMPFGFVKSLSPGSEWFEAMVGIPNVFARIFPVFTAAEIGTGLSKTLEEGFAKGIHDFMQFSFASFGVDEVPQLFEDWFNGIGKAATEVSHLFAPIMQAIATTGLAFIAFETTIWRGFDTLKDIRSVLAQKDVAMIVKGLLGIAYTVGKTILALIILPMRAGLVIAFEAIKKMVVSAFSVAFDSVTQSVTAMAGAARDVAAGAVEEVPPIVERAAKGALAKIRLLPYGDFIADSLILVARAIAISVGAIGYALWTVGKVLATFSIQFGTQLVKLFPMTTVKAIFPQFETLFGGIVGLIVSSTAAMGKAGWAFTQNFLKISSIVGYAAERGFVGKGLRGINPTDLFLKQFFPELEIVEKKLRYQYMTLEKAMGSSKAFPLPANVSIFAKFAAYAPAYLSIAGRMTFAWISWYSILKPINEEMFTAISRLELFGIRMDFVATLLKAVRFLIVAPIDFLMALSQALYGSGQSSVDARKSLETFFDVLNKISTFLDKVFIPAVKFAFKAIAVAVKVTWFVVKNATTIFYYLAYAVRSTVVGLFLALPILVVATIDAALIATQKLLQGVRYLGETLGATLIEIFYGVGAAIHGDFSLLAILWEGLFAERFYRFKDIVFSAISMALAAVGSALKSIFWTHLLAPLGQAIASAAQNIAGMVAHVVFSTITKAFETIGKVFRFLAWAITHPKAALIDLMLTIGGFKALVRGLPSLIGAMVKMPFNAIGVAITASIAAIILWFVEIKRGFVELDAIINALMRPIESVTNLLTNLIDTVTSPPKLPYQDQLGALFDFVWNFAKSALPVVVGGMIIFAMATKGPIKGLISIVKQLGGIGIGIMSLIPLMFQFGAAGMKAGKQVTSSFGFTTGMSQANLLLRGNKLAQMTPLGMNKEAVGIAGEDLQERKAIAKFRKLADQQQKRTQKALEQELISLMANKNEDPEFKHFFHLFTHKGIEEENNRRKMVGKKDHELLRVPDSKKREIGFGRFKVPMPQKVGFLNMGVKDEVTDAGKWFIAERLEHLKREGKMFRAEGDVGNVHGRFFGDAGNTFNDKMIADFAEKAGLKTVMGRDLTLKTMRPLLQNNSGDMRVLNDQMSAETVGRIEAQKIEAQELNIENATFKNRFRDSRKAPETILGAAGAAQDAPRILRETQLAVKSLKDLQETSLVKNNAKYSTFIDSLGKAQSITYGDLSPTQLMNFAQGLGIDVGDREKMYKRNPTTKVVSKGEFLVPAQQQVLTMQVMEKLGQLEAPRNSLIPHEGLITAKNLLSMNYEELLDLSRDQRLLFKSEKAMGGSNTIDTLVTEIRARMHPMVPEYDDNNQIVVKDGAQQFKPDPDKKSRNRLNIAKTADLGFIQKILDRQFLAFVEEGPVFKELDQVEIPVETALQKQAKKLSEKGRFGKFQASLLYAGDAIIRGLGTVIDKSPIGQGLNEIRRIQSELIPSQQARIQSQRSQLNSRALDSFGFDSKDNNFAYWLSEEGLPDIPGNKSEITAEDEIMKLLQDPQSSSQIKQLTSVLSSVRNSNGEIAQQIEQFAHSTTNPNLIAKELIRAAEAKGDSLHEIVGALRRATLTGDIYDERHLGQLLMAKSKIDPQITEALVKEERKAVSQQSAAKIISRLKNRHFTNLKSENTANGIWDKIKAKSGATNDEAVKTFLEAKLKNNSPELVATQLGLVDDIGDDTQAWLKGKGVKHFDAASIPRIAALVKILKEGYALEDEATTELLQRHEIKRADLETLLKQLYSEASISGDLLEDPTLNLKQLNELREVRQRHLQSLVNQARFRGVALKEGALHEQLGVKPGELESILSNNISTSGGGNTKSPYEQVFENLQLRATGSGIADYTEVDFAQEFSASSLMADQRSPKAKALKAITSVLSAPIKAMGLTDLISSYRYEQERQAWVGDQMIKEREEAATKLAALQGRERRRRAGLQTVLKERGMTYANFVRAVGGEDSEFNQLFQHFLETGKMKRDLESGELTRLTAGIEGVAGVNFSKIREMKGRLSSRTDTDSNGNVRRLPVDEIYRTAITDFFQKGQWHDNFNSDQTKELEKILETGGLSKSKLTDMLPRLRETKLDSAFASYIEFGEFNRRLNTPENLEAIRGLMGLENTAEVRSLLKNLGSNKYQPTGAIDIISAKIQMFFLGISEFFTSVSNGIRERVNKFLDSNLVAKAAVTFASDKIFSPAISAIKSRVIDPAKSAIAATPAFVTSLPGVRHGIAAKNEFTAASESSLPAMMQNVGLKDVEQFQARFTSRLRLNQVATDPDTIIKAFLHPSTEGLRTSVESVMTGANDFENAMIAFGETLSIGGARRKDLYETTDKVGRKEKMLNLAGGDVEHATRLFEEHMRVLSLTLNTAPSALINALTDVTSNDIPGAIRKLLELSQEEEKYGEVLQVFANTLHVSTSELDKLIQAGNYSVAAVAPLSFYFARQLPDAIEAVFGDIVEILKRMTLTSLKFAAKGAILIIGPAFYKTLSRLSLGLGNMAAGMLTGVNNAINRVGLPTVKDIETFLKHRLVLAQIPLLSKLADGKWVNKLRKLGESAQENFANEATVLEAARQDIANNIQGRLLGAILSVVSFIGEASTRISAITGDALGKLGGLLKQLWSSLLGVGTKLVGFVSRKLGRAPQLQRPQPFNSTPRSRFELNRNSLLPLAATEERISRSSQEVEQLKVQRQTAQSRVRIEALERELTTARSEREAILRQQPAIVEHDNRISQLGQEISQRRREVPTPEIVAQIGALQQQLSVAPRQREAITQGLSAEAATEHQNFLTETERSHQVPTERERELVPVIERQRRIDETAALPMGKFENSFKGIIEGLREKLTSTGTAMQSQAFATAPTRTIVNRTVDVDNYTPMLQGGSYAPESGNKRVVVESEVTPLISGGFIATQNAAKRMTQKVGTYFLDSAARAETAWDEAGQEITGRTFKDMIRRSYRTGRKILGNIAQASPGPTVEIPRHYAHAAERVEGSLEQIATAAHEAGNVVTTTAHQAAEAAVHESNHVATVVAEATHHAAEAAVHESNHVAAVVAEDSQRTANTVGGTLSRISASVRHVGSAIGSVGKAGFAIGGAVTAVGFASQTVVSSLTTMGMVDEKTSQSLYKFTELFTLVGAIVGLGTPIFTALVSTLGAVTTTGGALISVLTGVGSLLAGAFFPVIVPLTMVVSTLLLVNWIIKQIFGTDLISAFFTRVSEGFSWIGNWFNQTGSAIGEGTPSWLTGMGEAFEKIKPMFQPLTNWLGEVLAPLAPLGKAIAYPFELASNAISASVDRVKMAWQGFSDQFGPTLFPIVQHGIDAGIGLINALNHSPTVQIPIAWEGAVEGIKEYLSGLLKFATAIGGAMIAALAVGKLSKMLAGAASPVAKTAGRVGGNVVGKLAYVSMYANVANDLAGLVGFELPDFVQPLLMATTFVGVMGDFSTEIVPAIIKGLGKIGLTATMLSGIGIAVAAAFGIFYVVWTKNLFGIQEKTALAILNLKEAWSNFVAYLLNSPIGKIFSKISDSITGIFHPSKKASVPAEKVADSWSAASTDIGKSIDKIPTAAETAGKESIDALNHSPTIKIPLAWQGAVENIKGSLNSLRSPTADLGAVMSDKLGSPASEVAQTWAEFTQGIEQGQEALVNSVADQRVDQQVGASGEKEDRLAQVTAIASQTGAGARTLFDDAALAISRTLPGVVGTSAEAAIAAPVISTGSDSWQTNFPERFQPKNEVLDTLTAQMALITDQQQKTADEEWLSTKIISSARDLFGDLVSASGKKLPGELATDEPKVPEVVPESWSKIPEHFQPKNEALTILTAQFEELSKLEQELAPMPKNSFTAQVGDSAKGMVGNLLSIFAKKEPKTPVVDKSNDELLETLAAQFRVLDDLQQSAVSEETGFLSQAGRGARDFLNNVSSMSSGVANAVATPEIPYATKVASVEKSADDWTNLPERLQPRDQTMDMLSYQFREQLNLDQELGEKKEGGLKGFLNKSIAMGASLLSTLSSEDIGEVSTKPQLKDETFDTLNAQFKLLADMEQKNAENPETSTISLAGGKARDFFDNVSSMSSRAISEQLPATIAHLKESIGNEKVDNWLGTLDSLKQKTADETGSTLSGAKAFLGNVSSMSSSAVTALTPTEIPYAVKTASVEKSADDWTNIPERLQPRDQAMDMLSYQFREQLSLDQELGEEQGGLKGLLSKSVAMGTRLFSTSLSEGAAPIAAGAEAWSKLPDKFQQKDDTFEALSSQFKLLADTEQKNAENPERDAISVVSEKTQGFFDNLSAASSKAISEQLPGMASRLKESIDNGGIGNWFTNLVSRPQIQNKVLDTATTAPEVQSVQSSGIPQKIESNELIPIPKSSATPNLVPVSVGVESVKTQEQLPLTQAVKPSGKEWFGTFKDRYLSKKAELSKVAPVAESSVAPGTVPVSTGAETVKQSGKEWFGTFKDRYLSKKAELSKSMPVAGVAGSSVALPSVPNFADAKAAAITASTAKATEIETKLKSLGERWVKSDKMPSGMGKDKEQLSTKIAINDAYVALNKELATLPPSSPPVVPTDKPKTSATPEPAPGNFFSQFLDRFKADPNKELNETLDTHFGTLLASQERFVTVMEEGDTSGVLKAILVKSKLTANKLTAIAKDEKIQTKQGIKIERTGFFGGISNWIDEKTGGSLTAVDNFRESGMSGWFGGGNKPEKTELDPVILDFSKELNSAIAVAQKSGNQAAFKELELIASSTGGQLTPGQYGNLINPENNLASGGFLKDQVTATNVAAKKSRLYSAAGTVGGAMLGKTGDLKEQADAVREMLAPFNGGGDLLGAEGAEYANDNKAFLSNAQTRLEDLGKQIADAESEIQKKTQGDGAGEKKEGKGLFGGLFGGDKPGVVPAKETNQIVTAKIAINDIVMAMQEKMPVQLSDDKRKMLLSVGISPDGVERLIKDTRLLAKRTNRTWTSRWALLQRTKGRGIMGVFLPSGQQIKYGFTQLLDAAGTFIGEAAEAISKFDLNGLGNAFVKVAQVGGAALGSIIQGFASAAYSAVIFGVFAISSISPVLLIAIGIALAAFAIQQNFLGIRTILEGVGDIAKSIWQAFVDTRDMVIEVKEGLGLMATGIQTLDFDLIKIGAATAFGALKDWIFDIAGNIEGVLMGALKVLEGVLEGIGQVLHKVFGAPKDLMEGLIAKIEDFRLGIGGISTTLAELISSVMPDWTKFAELIDSIVSKLPKIRRRRGEVESVTEGAIVATPGADAITSPDGEAPAESRRKGLFQRLRRNKKQAVIEPGLGEDLSGISEIPVLEQALESPTSVQPVVVQQPKFTPPPVVEQAIMLAVPEPVAEAPAKKRFFGRAKTTPPPVVEQAIAPPVPEPVAETPAKKGFFGRVFDKIKNVGSKQKPTEAISSPIPASIPVPVPSPIPVPKIQATPQLMAGVSSPNSNQFQDLSVRAMQANMSMGRRNAVSLGIPTPVVTPPVERTEPLPVSRVLPQVREVLPIKNTMPALMPATIEATIADNVVEAVATPVNRRVEEPPVIPTQAISALGKVSQDTSVQGIVDSMPKTRAETILRYQQIEADLMAEKLASASAYRKMEEFKTEVLNRTGGDFNKVQQADIERMRSYEQEVSAHQRNFQDKVLESQIYQAKLTTTRGKILTFFSELDAQGKAAALRAQVVAKAAAIRTDIESRLTETGIDKKFSEITENAKVKFKAMSTAIGDRLEESGVADKFRSGREAVTARLSGWRDRLINRRTAIAGSAQAPGSEAPAVRNVNPERYTAIKTAFSGTTESANKLRDALWQISPAAAAPFTAITSLVEGIAQMGTAIPEAINSTIDLGKSMVDMAKSAFASLTGRTSASAASAAAAATEAAVVVPANAAIAASNVQVSGASALATRTQVQGALTASTASVGSAGIISTACAFISSAFATMSAAISAAWAAFIAPLAPFLLPILGAVILAVGLLYLAFKNNFLGLRDIVNGVIEGIKLFFSLLVQGASQDFGAVVASIGKMFNEIGAVLGDLAKTLFEAFLPVLSLFGMGGAGNGGMAMAAVIKTLVRVILLPIKIITTAIVVIVTMLTFVIKVVGAIGKLLFKVVLSPVWLLSLAFSGIIKLLMTIGKFTVIHFLTPFKIILDVVDKILDILGAVAGAIVKAFVSPFATALNLIKFVGKGISNIPFAGKLFGNPQNTAPVAANTGGNQPALYPGQYPPVAATLGSTQPTLYPTSKPQGFAKGGLIIGAGGPTEDKVPALLSPGEFVVTAAATAPNLAFLEALNENGSAKKFAEGGLVTGSGSRAETVTITPVAPKSVVLPPSLERSASSLASERGESGNGDTTIELNLSFGDIHLSGASSSDSAQEFMELIQPKLERMVLEALRQRLEMNR